ncbi:hypothetical protein B0H14DRAFT_3904196 [Mycena olivaceomarginata]|nr:hypothetical protein B0H14DRAFT_3904196 [Mycena olivaceomarginata]
MGAGTQTVNTSRRLDTLRKLLAQEQSFVSSSGRVTSHAACAVGAVLAEKLDAALLGNGGEKKGGIFGALSVLGEVLDGLDGLDRFEAVRGLPLGSPRAFSSRTPCRHLHPHLCPEWPCAPQVGFIARQALVRRYGRGLLRGCAVTQSNAVQDGEPPELLREAAGDQHVVTDYCLSCGKELEDARPYCNEQCQTGDPTSPSLSAASSAFSSLHQQYTHGQDVPALIPSALGRALRGYTAHDHYSASSSSASSTSWSVLTATTTASSTTPTPTPTPTTSTSAQTPSPTPATPPAPTTPGAPAATAAPPPPRRLSSAPFPRALSRSATTTGIRLLDSNRASLPDSLPFLTKRVSRLGTSREVAVARARGLRDLRVPDSNAEAPAKKPRKISATRQKQADLELAPLVGGNVFGREGGIFGAPSVLGEVLDGLYRLLGDIHLDLLVCFLPEHRAVIKIASTPRGSNFDPLSTRTHTFLPNGRARRRSGLLPVRPLYGDMGGVFFVGVRLRTNGAQVTLMSRLSTMNAPALQGVAKTIQGTLIAIDICEYNSSVGAGETLCRTLRILGTPRPGVVQSTRTSPIRRVPTSRTNYVPLFPGLGKANSLYDRSVPATNLTPHAILPGAELLLDTLMSRDEFVDHPVSQELLDASPSLVASLCLSCSDLQCILFRHGLAYTMLPPRGHTSRVPVQMYRKAPPPFSLDPLILPAHTRTCPLNVPPAVPRMHKGFLDQLVAQRHPGRTPVAPPQLYSQDPSRPSLSPPSTILAPASTWATIPSSSSSARDALADTPWAPCADEWAWPAATCRPGA